MNRAMCLPVARAVTPLGITCFARDAAQISRADAA
jgi:hypothetical protein